VSGSRDKTLLIYDLQSGKLLHTCTGHDGTLRSIAITADDRYVISVSHEDHLIRVWALATGEALRTIEGDSESQESVVVTPDTRYIIVGARDRTIRVYNFKTGDLVFVLEGHERPVLSVTLTRDGQNIISTSEDKTTRVWSLQTGEQLRLLRGHSGGVYEATVTIDGRRLLTCSFDGQIHIWNLLTSEMLRAFPHTGRVGVLCESPDGRQLATGTDDDRIHVWDLGTGELIQTLEGHKNAIDDLIITPDGCHIISASSDKSVRVWDLHSGEQIHLLKGHTDAVGSVVITPDSRYILSGGRDDAIRVWDAKTGAPVKVLKGHSGRVHGITIAPDGHHVLSGAWDETVRVWDLEEGKLVRTLPRHTKSVGPVATTQDGRHIISGAREDKVVIWDPATGEVLRSLKGHRSRVLSVAVSPCGKYIVSGGHDNTVKVWDLAKGTLLRVLRGHDGAVGAVAVTQDCRRIISGSSDKTAALWDFEGCVLDLYLLTLLPIELQDRMLGGGSGLWTLVNNYRKAGRKVFNCLYWGGAHLEHLEGGFLPQLIPYLSTEHQKEYIRRIQTTCREIPLRYAVFRRQLGYLMLPWRLRLWFSPMNPAEFPSEDEVTEIPLTKETQREARMNVQLPDRKETAIHFKLAIEDLPIEYGPWIEAVILTMESDRGDKAEVRFTDFAWDSDRHHYSEWASFKLDSGYSVSPEAILTVTGYRLEYTSQMQPREFSPLEMMLFTELRQIVSSRLAKVDREVLGLSQSVEEILQHLKQETPKEERPKVGVSNIRRRPKSKSGDPRVKPSTRTAQPIGLQRLQDPPEWREAYEEFQNALEQPDFPKIIVKLGARGSVLGRFVESIEAKIIALTFLPGIAGFLATWVFPTLPAPWPAAGPWVLMFTYLFIAIIGCYVIVRYILGGFQVRRRRRRRIAGSR
jgi:WD40 repeat protein